MEQYRVCNHCKQTKLLSYFGKNRSYSTGYTKTCLECGRIRSRQYRKRNLYAQRQYSLNWKINNPEKHKALLAKHKQVKLSAGALKKKYGTERKLVRKKDIVAILKNPCIYCGSKAKLSIDHVIPLSRGGRHAVGNLASACIKCNCSKRNQTVMEWRIKCLRANAELTKRNEREK